jgi:hypothetical protein
MTGKIAWSTREVGVDRDGVRLTELSEEASVLVAWLWWGGLGATWVGTLHPSVPRHTGDQSHTTWANLNGKGLLGEARGETRIDIEVLIVVNMLDTNIGASTGRACTLESVTILELSGEFGWIWRPRAINILLRGIRERNGSGARDVTDLVLNAVEGGSPRPSEGGLGVRLN